MRIEQVNSLLSSNNTRCNVKNDKSSPELIFQSRTNSENTGIKIERKMQDSTVSKLPTAPTSKVFNRQAAKIYAQGCTPEELYSKEKFIENGFEPQNIEEIKNEDGSISYIIPQLVLNDNLEFEVQYMRMDFKENSDGSKVVGLYPGSHNNKSELFNNDNYYPSEYRVLKKNLCYERYFIGDNGNAIKNSYEFATVPLDNAISF